MSIFSILGVLSPVHITYYNLKNKLFYGGKYVGEDVTGNRYFTAKPREGYKKPRRWVIYKGKPEASKVPPEWHGWLHYQTDVVPSEESQSYRREWQTPHKPNMTGTKEAYMPSGHMLKGGQREKATGDYEAWTPPSQ